MEAAVKTNRTRAHVLVSLFTLSVSSSPFDGDSFSLTQTRKPARHRVRTHTRTQTRKKKERRSSPIGAILFFANSELLITANAGKFSPHTILPRLPQTGPGGRNSEFLPSTPANAAAAYPCVFRRRRPLNAAALASLQDTTATATSRAIRTESAAGSVPLRRAAATTGPRTGAVFVDATAATGAPLRLRRLDDVVQTHLDFVHHFCSCFLIRTRRGKSQIETFKI